MYHGSLLFPSAGCIFYPFMLHYLFNPNYSLEAKRANELVGFNPDLEKLE